VLSVQTSRRRSELLYLLAIISAVVSLGVRLPGGLAPSTLYASDAWPEFRGPTADGHSDASDLPIEWSETQNVRWKTPIHGRAWSTPVIHGTQVWLSTATVDGKKLSAICVDRDTGAVLHDRVLFEVDQPQPLGNELNCYASPSPLIEAGRVFLTFGSAGTACLDTATFVTIWERRDLPCNHFRGPASSLFRVDGKVVFHMDGSDHQYIVALDRQDGRTVWRTDRSVDYGDVEADGKIRADGDFRKAYSTPIRVRHAGRDMLISAAAKAVYGYDATNGRELWRVRFDGHSTASRPVFLDGVAYVNTGYSKAELWAIRVDGEGDVTDSHVLWRRKKNVPNRSSPLVIGSRIFSCSDQGIASCIDARTGDEIWVDRIGGEYSASPVYASGRIYYFAQDGSTIVIRPGDTLEVVARNRLDDGFMASPAISGRAFFLRTKMNLYRIEAP
jgi:outer membrane protein assembly factor BamB